MGSELCIRDSFNRSPASRLRPWTGDPGVRPGTASLTHGRSTAPPGVLTSTTVDVDPLTAMPMASGLAVSVRPA